MTPFDGKVILITEAPVRRSTIHFLSREFHQSSQSYSFSRDEMKQWKMAQAFVGYDNVRFSGDVRDKERQLELLKVLITSSTQQQQKLSQRLSTTP